MYVSVLLLTTLIPWALNAPSPTDRQLALKRDLADPPADANNAKRPKTSTDSSDSRKIDSADPPVLGSEEPKKCIYEGGRRTVPGKVTRPSVSEVSASCSGKFIELSKLTIPNEFLGTKNELQLISVRGSAAFAKDFSKPEVIAEFSGQFICGGHLKELSSQWNSRDFSHYVRANGIPKCSYPDDYHGLKRPNIKGAKFIYSPSCSVTLEEASAVMTLEKLLLPVGLPVCAHHKQQLQQAVTSLPASGPVPIILRSGTEYFPSNDFDSTSSTSIISSDTVKTFRAFAASAGEARLAGWMSLSSVEPRTSKKKTCATRRLIDVIFKVVGKDKSKEFAESVLSPAASVWMTKRTSHRYNDLMAIVSERFYKAIGRRDKELSLALIAKAVPLQEIRIFIPGLTERMYYTARRIALAGLKLDTERYLRCRFNPAKLKYYIDFITGPMVHTDIPFGHKKVTASDGTKYTIPNSLRLQRASEIVHMYITSMKKNNLGHMLFSTSTLYKILQYCSATERKASVCADFYFSESEIAFNDLNALTGFLHETRTVSSQWKEQKGKEIKEFQFYLRGDYRLHTKSQSRVADHCWTHSLSDPSDRKLSKTCKNQVPGESHAHDLKCDRCELGKSIMREFWETLNEFESEVDNKAESDDKKRVKEEVEDWKAKLQQAEERIEEYKKHQLRSSFSRKVHEEMVDQAEEQTATLILDFSQKYLPQKYLEPQSDYFGKKGMSSHVTHVQTKKSGRIAQHQMVHIIENDQQDSISVIQLIRHVFEELKKADITSVLCRSDNAGCYHSSVTIGALHKLGKETGMKVHAYGFSESQDGKSAADRVSGQFKNKVRAFVNAGGDASNHQEFFTAATSGRLLEATSFYLVRTQEMKAPSVKIDKISGLYDFAYEDKGIRAWRHKGIGEGIFIPASSFEKSLSSLPSLTVIAKGGHLPEDHPDGVGYWRLSPLAPAATTCPKEDIKPLLGVIEKKPFHCPDISCSASFDSAEELEVHWLAGAHCTSPMTTTLRDESLKMFSAGLEITISHRLDIPDVDDAIAELAQSDSDDKENVEEGWALKKRKGSVRFTEKARAFIEDIFDEGIRQKHKVPAEEAERRMANARENGERVFAVEERLNARQISSLYNRIAAFRENEAANKNHRLKRFVDMEMSEDGEFDEVSMFDEAWYMNDQDLTVQSIWHNRHEIFDMGKEVEVDHDEIFKSNVIRESKKNRKHRRHLVHYLL